MKLELKNIKLGPGSEETTQFTAKLYINDKLVAHCDNAGKGGCTDIDATVEKISYEKEKEKYLAELKAQRALIQQAEEYCKTLPPVKSRFGEFPMDLELWISTQVDNQQIFKAMDKDTSNKVVLVSKKAFEDFKAGISDGLQYSTIKYPNPFSRYSPEAKRTIVERATAQLTGDEFIYNSNLPKQ